MASMESWQLSRVPPACPRHPAVALERRGSEVRGHWRCPRCRAGYPVRDGIADLAGDSALTDPAFAAEAAQWDRQAGAYDERRARDPVYTAGVDAAVRALAPTVGEAILDAGCGTGMTVRAYYPAGPAITALDASAESLRHLRGSLPAAAPVQCVRGHLARLPFADGSFDAVLCANVLQQVEGAATRARCVRELARVVRPGGRLVLTVHQYSIPRRWSGYAREGAAGGHSGAVRFVHRFDPPELAALLADTVRITRLHGAGFPLPYRYKLSGLSRSLERLLRRVRWARPFGTMLVAVGRKPQAETAGRAEPAGILSLVAAMLVAPGAGGL